MEREGMDKSIKMNTLHNKRLVSQQNKEMKSKEEYTKRIRKEVDLKPTIQSQRSLAELDVLTKKKEK